MWPFINVLSWFQKPFHIQDDMRYQMDTLQVEYLYFSFPHSPSCCYSQLTDWAGHYAADTWGFFLQKLHLNSSSSSLVLWCQCTVLTRHCKPFTIFIISNPRRKYVKRHIKWTFSLCMFLLWAKWLHFSKSLGRVYLQLLWQHLWKASVH